MIGKNDRNNNSPSLPSPHTLDLCASFPSRKANVKDKLQSIPQHNQVRSQSIQSNDTFQLKADALGEPKTSLINHEEKLPATQYTEYGEPNKPSSTSAYYYASNYTDEIDTHEDTHSGIYNFHQLIRTTTA